MGDWIQPIPGYRCLASLLEAGLLGSLVYFALYVTTV